MTITTVGDGDRLIDRRLKTALGNDIVRYLIELITNSDDSYNRIENYTGEKDIIIDIIPKGAGNFEISVTDYAEGMSEETLNKIFSKYGNDNAGGLKNNVRGIFGQGASDVLRNACFEGKKAEIHSIKDGICSHLKYLRQNSNFVIDVSAEEVTGEIRDQLGIPYNGTVIIFGIPSSVQFKGDISKLADKLNITPSLRYILDNDTSDKKVILRNKSLLTSIRLNSSKYQFNNECLLDHAFSFPFQGETIMCNLVLYEKDKKDMTTEIIVRDEKNNVFANTWFDFGNHQAISHIKGELEIRGFYKLCHDYLNEKKDTLIKDNRTGFETKNDFYLELNKSIYPIIKRFLDSKTNKEDTTDLTKNKDFNEGIREINRYLKQELKEKINGGTMGTNKQPPEEGLAFVRSSIVITRGKQYSIKLLINPDKIKVGTPIYIDYKMNDYVEISPDSVIFEEKDIDNEVRLVTKNISISARNVTTDSIEVKAKCGEYSANLNIQVIEADIHYPEDGFEFYPNNLSLVYNKRHTAKLYIDSNVIPLGSIISVSFEGLKGEKEYTFGSENLIGLTEIGMINVVTEGGDVDDEFDVLAETENLKSTVHISLKESVEQRNPGEGLLRGVKIEPNELGFQAYYNPSDKFIYINSSNPINRCIVGDFSGMDHENPKFKKNEQTRYICDIIADQTARLLVKEKDIKKGIIDFEGDPEGVVDQVQELIQKHKNEIYFIMYKALVGE